MDALTWVGLGLMCLGLTVSAASPRRIRIAAALCFVVGLVLLVIGLGYVHEHDDTVIT